MMTHGYKITVNDHDQMIYYFLLPKSLNDLLNINMPLIINENIDKWLSSDDKMDLFLHAKNNKYTFRDSLVIREVKCNNMYGVPCRDVYISHGTMLNGFQLRGK